MNDAKKDLTVGSVPKTLILFSLPFVLSTLLQTFYSMVDMIVVGHFVGSPGLSAVSTGSQLMDMITIFTVGFSTAGQIIISQHIGAGKTEQVKRINQTLCTTIFVFALVLSVIGITGRNLFIRLLNVPDEAVAYAQDYVLICSIGIVFTAFYNMIAAIFRGMGDGRHPLIFITIATVTNIVLDLLFVGVFRWEVKGAAIATIIGQALSVCLSLLFLYRNQETFYFQFRIRGWKPDAQLVGMLFRLGLPLAIQSSAIHISFLFVNSLINDLGVAVSATFGAGQKLRNIPGILTQAVGLGATAMIGQCFGAGKYDRVSSVYKWGVAVNAVINVLFVGTYNLFPQQTFRLFSTDPGVMEYAALYMTAILIEAPGRAFMPSGGALISGCGNTRLSMTIAFLDAFAGRVLLTWLLGKRLGFGVAGYFIGFTLATYVTAIPQVAYYLSGKWRKRKSLVTEGVDA